MKPLIEFLTNELTYDNSWAIYAEKIDGRFESESPARFGQRIFINGGTIDNCEYFANNEQICETRQEYCGSEDNSHEFWEEWGHQYIADINLNEISD